jgi:hypothetical protein
MITDGR